MSSSCVSPIAYFVLLVTVLQVEDVSCANTNVRLKNGLQLPASVLEDLKELWIRGDKVVAELQTDELFDYNEDSIQRGVLDVPPNCAEGQWDKEAKKCRILWTENAPKEPTS